MLFFHKCPAGDNVLHSGPGDHGPDGFQGGSVVHDRRGPVGHLDPEHGHHRIDAVGEHHADMRGFIFGDAAQIAAQTDGLHQQIAVPDGSGIIGSVFPDLPEGGKAFGQKRELRMERAFLRSRHQFGIRAQFGEGDPEFIGGNIPFDGFADGHGRRMGQFIGPAQFKFAEIAGEDAAPGHADPERNDRDLDIIRQENGQALLEGGHQPVAGDIALGENADQFAVGQGMAGFFQQLLEPFRLAGGDLQKTGGFIERTHEGVLEIPFVHHEPDRPGGTGGNQEDIDKRGAVGGQQCGALRGDPAPADDPQPVEGPHEHFHQHAQQELRHQREGDDRQGERHDRQSERDPENRDLVMEHQIGERHGADQSQTERDIEPGEIGRVLVAVDKILLIRLHRHQGQAGEKSDPRQQQKQQSAFYIHIGIIGQGADQEIEYRHGCGRGRDQSDLHVAAAAPGSDQTAGETAENGRGQQQEKINGLTLEYAELGADVAYRHGCNQDQRAENITFADAGQDQFPEPRLFPEGFQPGAGQFHDLDFRIDRTVRIETRRQDQTVERYHETVDAGRPESSVIVLGDHKSGQRDDPARTDTEKTGGFRAGARPWQMIPLDHFRRVAFQRGAVDGIFRSEQQNDDEQRDRMQGHCAAGSPPGQFFDQEDRQSSQQHGRHFRRPGDDDDIPAGIPGGPELNRSAGEHHRQSQKGKDQQNMIGEPVEDGALIKNQQSREGAEQGRIERTEEIHPRRVPDGIMVPVHVHFLSLRHMSLRGWIRPPANQVLSIYHTFRFFQSAMPIL